MLDPPADGHPLDRDRAHGNRKPAPWSFADVIAAMETLRGLLREAATRTVGLLTAGKR
jgi:hypothetical protein